MSTQSATQSGKINEAPLTHGDLPEQDGSEDPGVGLEFIHDSGGDAPGGKTTARARPEARTEAQTDRPKTKDS